MSLNLTAKDCYHVFDKFGMLCIPSDRSLEKRSWWKKLWDWILIRIWIPTWSNKSWRDSIGRTVLAWIAYGGPYALSASVWKCYNKVSHKLYRHPDHKELASRDHWSYFIIQSFLIDPCWINKEVKHWTGMRGMNAWMKALTGNKRAEFFYYFWVIPSARIGNGFLRFCRWVGRITPEQDNDVWITEGSAFEDEVWMTLGYYLLWSRTRWQKLWAWIIFQTMPAYALHNKAWQIYIMPESRRKEKLKRILLKRIAPRNLLLRLLLGDDTVTQEEIDAYPDMTGFPPGEYTDETCRRDIRELTDKEAEFNTYEVELIKWLFNKQKS